MHEYGLVDALIAEFLKTPRARTLPAVRRVRVRYGPGLTAAAVRQAFAVQSRGTPLAGAALELERREDEVRCACGASLAPFPPEPHDHGHDHDHEHDHGLPYAECAACGAVLPIPHFDALEVVDAG